MTIRFSGRERWAAAAVGISLALLPVAAPLPLSSAFTAAAVAQTNKPVLRIGAIPDQKPEKLNRLYGLVANELSKQLVWTSNMSPSRTTPRRLVPSAPAIWIWSGLAA